MIGMQRTGIRTVQSKELRLQVGIKSVQDEVTNVVAYISEWLGSHCVAQEPIDAGRIVALYPVHAVGGGSSEKGLAHLSDADQAAFVAQNAEGPRFRAGIPAVGWVDKWGLSHKKTTLWIDALAEKVS